MITDICYYIFASSTCCFTAFGLYYIYDKKTAKRLLYRMGWEGLELYTRCKLFLNENVYNSCESPKILSDDEEDHDRETKQDKLILHNIATNKYETHIEIPTGIQYDWLVIKKYNLNGPKYKVIENIEKYKKNKISSWSEITYKPFLQIEMEQDGVKIEIQENLDIFFLENNKILDKTFLLWYMKFFYNVDLLTLHNKQYVLLEANNYIVKDN